MFINGKTFITFAQIFKFNPNGLRFLYPYSSLAPDSFLVAYLVSSVGFTKEEAITTSAKVKKQRTSSAKVISQKAPDLVLDFLKQTGLDQTQMKKLVSRVPELLFYNVGRILKPKFQCLCEEFGLSVSDLVNVLARDKSILERGLDSHLRPRLDFLRTVLGSNENVLKVIKKSSWLLTFGTHKTLIGNISLMREFGMSNEQIKKLVLRRPNYIAQNSNKVLDLLNMVEKDFGVPCGSAMFVYAADVLVSVNKSKLETKMKIFKSFGWSDNDVFMMFSKMPYCFNQSEARIEKVLSLFMTELGFKPAYLASHPSILAYHLDKRVVPRLEVLRILDQEKLGKKKLTLYGALTLSESKFLEKFVLPYKAQIPHLYEPHKKALSQ